MMNNDLGLGIVVSMKDAFSQNAQRIESSMTSLDEGALVVNGVRYLETGEETNTIGIFFRFDEAEANGITIREYGFFGGDVEYVASVSGDLAMGGVFHQDTNPVGEVLRPGYLYEVKNIPDFNKISDTRVELVGIIKI